MSVSIRADSPRGSVEIAVQGRIRVVDPAKDLELEADSIVQAVEMASAALGLSVFYIAQQLDARARR